MARISRVPTDYDEIKEEVRRLLQSNSVIYSMFPGDSSTFLVELFSAVATMLAYKVDFGLRNSYLPTLYTKGAAYALASTLGYIPKRKQPATVEVEFTGMAEVPAWSEFSIDSKIWICETGFSVSGGQPTIKLLTQASKKTELFTGTGKKFQSFSLSYGSSIVNDSIIVYVDNIQWQRTSSFISSNQSSKKIYLERCSYNGNVVIVFGDGVFSEIPPPNSRIEITYLVTEGKDGNSIPPNREVVPNFQLLPTESLIGKTRTPSSGGSEEDSVESIKFLAPRLFAAADRAVRRDDYVAHLLKNPQLSSASVMGEYEFLLESGYSDYSRMNRIDVSFIRGEIYKSEIISTTNQGSSTYTFNTADVPLYLGSVFVEEKSVYGEIFQDLDGYMVPTRVVENAFSSGSVVSEDPKAANAFSVDEKTWDTGVVLQEDSKVSVGYSLSSPAKIVALRFKISSSLQDKLSIPARVTVFASNADEPDLSSTDQSSNWIFVGSMKIRRLSRILGVDWIRLYPKSNYRHYAIVFSGVSYSSGGTFRISTIQALEESKCGTIDYYTGSITVKFSNNPSANNPLVVRYCYGDFSATQAKNIIESLNAVKPVQINLVYSRPRIVRLDVKVIAYYDSTHKVRGLRDKVDQIVRSFFKIKPSSMGRKVFRSDLISALSSIEGISGVEVLSPSSDVDLSFNEVVFPDSVDVSWVPARK